VRKEATGYGTVYFVREMLKARGDTLEGKTCTVSGSGNVAIYTIEKLNQLGREGHRVLGLATASSTTRRHRPRRLVKQLKEVERRRIAEYARQHKDARYLAGGSIWDVPATRCALPCATQNEIDETGTPRHW
jgi:glutamate dehydrogenase (NADP+)